MATIFVTGGAGYLGSHLCAALAAAGHLPVSYDNLAHGRLYAVRWGPLVIGDLRERDRLGAALRQYRPDVVVHCAAARATEGGQPHRDDIAGSLALLEAMKLSGRGALVFTSSAAVYGDAGGPADEEHDTAAADPAAVAKLVIEQMIRDGEPAYGIRSVILRLPHVAGLVPDCAEPDAMPPDGLLGRAVLAAIEGRGVVAVRGLGPAGNADRAPVGDYLHVSDAVEGVIRSIDYLLDGGGAATLNLGTGRGASVPELLAAVERVTGRAVRAAVIRGGPAEAAHRVPVAERAAQVLGWRPRHSDLDAIIDSLIPRETLRPVR